MYKALSLLGLLVMIAALAGLYMIGSLLGGGLMRMLSEERLVAAKYPEYGEYAKRTKRMIPFVF